MDAALRRAGPRRGAVMPYGLPTNRGRGEELGDGRRTTADLRNLLKMKHDG